MNATPGQIHEIPPEDVFDLLRSRSGGLTDEEAAARRREVGLNRLEPPTKWRWAKLLVKHFVNFFSILLDMAKLNIPFQASGMVTTRKLLRSDPLMLERVGRATADAIKFIVAPANKKTILQTMSKNLKLAKPDRLEASYNDLVEELPRSAQPWRECVRS